MLKINQDVKCYFAFNTDNNDATIFQMKLRW